MPAIPRETLKSIRADMDAALEVVRKKYSLSELKCGKCTFTDGGAFTMKVEGLASDGLSSEASRYNMYRQFNKDLPPLYFLFTNGGESFTVIGMNTTGTKVLCKQVSTGKVYLFRTDHIINLAKKVA